MSKVAKYLPTPSMTSLELSELTEVRHDSVKRTIERLVEQEVIDLPQIVKGSITRSNGRKMPVVVYTFTGDKGKRDCLVLLTQLSSRFAGKVVDRWQELEAHFQNESLRIVARQDSKNLFRKMTDKIKKVIEASGRKPTSDDYIQEANMLNQVIFGMTAAQLRIVRKVKQGELLRDYLTKPELDAINALQDQNAILFAFGAPIQERAKFLRQMYREDHAALIDSQRVLV